MSRTVVSRVFIFFFYFNEQHVNLYDCLENFFAKEVLNGSDAHHCSTCDKSTKSSRKYTITDLPEVCLLNAHGFVFFQQKKKKIDLDFLNCWVLVKMQCDCILLLCPQILCVHLRRFKRHQSEKDTRIVSFPLDALNLGEYCDVPGTAEYTLMSLVAHSGTFTGLAFNQSKKKEKKVALFYFISLMNVFALLYQMSFVTLMCFFLLQLIRRAIFSDCAGPVFGAMVPMLQQLCATYFG
jgi:ubiquitin C-terminal hydrolase